MPFPTPFVLNNTKGVPGPPGPPGAAGAPGTATVPFSSLASTTPGATRTSVFLDGYLNAGDGGEGVFYWVQGSSATPDGGTISAGPGGSNGRWIRATAGRELDVFWFGATGNGSSDDTAAIQAALNAAAGTGRHLRFGRPGSSNTFKVSATLIIGSGTTLIGNGSQTTISYTGSGICFYRLNPINGSFSDYLQMRDLTITYAGGATPSTTYTGTNGASLPMATIQVASTAGFPSAGRFTLMTSQGPFSIGYTGKTSTTFTGCDSPSLVGYTVASGAAVSCPSIGLCCIDGSNGFIDNVTCTGFTYGAVLDQAESYAVTNGTWRGTVAGIWIPNGTFALGANTGFANVITIRNNGIFGQVAGIIDEGGVQRLIAENNFSLAQPTQAAWASGTSYPLGSLVYGPSDRGGTVWSSSGGTSGGSEPPWTYQNNPGADVLGLTTTDNTITWTAVGRTGACGVYFANQTSGHVNHNYFEISTPGVICSNIEYWKYIAGHSAGGYQNSLITIEHNFFNSQPAVLGQTYNSNCALQFKSNFHAGQGIIGAGGFASVVSSLNPGSNPELSPYLVDSGGVIAGNVSTYNQQDNVHSTTWQPNRAYPLGYMLAAVAGGQTRIFICTTAGTSGTTQPTWPSTFLGTVTDGGAVWTNNGITTGTTLTGYNTLHPLCTVDIAGSLALRAVAFNSIVAGTNNDVQLPPFASVINLLSGASGAMTITGFCHQADGKWLRIRNWQAQTMTFKHRTGSMTLNQIFLPGASTADVTVAAPAAGTFSYADFEYDAQNANGWLLKGHS